MESNRPPLRTCMGITVALEDLEGDAFLAERLGKGKSAQASAQDKDVWCLGCAAAHYRDIDCGWEYDNNFACLSCVLRCPSLEYNEKLGAASHNQGKTYI